MPGRDRNLECLGSKNKSVGARGSPSFLGFNRRGATPAGLRDRALIALMVHSFARIGAAVAINVEDVFTQNRRLWVLYEKSGKDHAMTTDHTLEQALETYMNGASLVADSQGTFFRTIGRGRGQLTRTPLPRANACAMIRRRPAADGIETKIGNQEDHALSKASEAR